MLSTQSKTNGIAPVALALLGPKYDMAELILE